MIFAPPFARAVTHPLDLSPDVHDLRLERGEFAIVPGLFQGQQAGQFLCPDESSSGFGEPLVLIYAAWTHGYSLPLQGRADNGMKLRNRVG